MGSHESGHMRIGRSLEIGITVLIIANVVAVTLGTVGSIQNRLGEFLDLFEGVSVLIFSVEYALRLWACTANPRFSNALTGRLRYALQPLSIIDLLSILPFYFPVIGLDLRSLRVFRMFRILRLFRIGHYNASLALIVDVLKSKREELVLILFIMSILLMVSSTILFYCEYEAQPTVFSSIPAAMWWSVATLTTVGYGDIYPITIMGKIFGSLISVIGVGMFALPAGVLGAGFTEALKKRGKSSVCPHCGKTL